MSKLTKNFSRKEFACRCGCGFDDISMDLVQRLQRLRDRIGKPLYVNSGCRCAAHNAAVRGTKKSNHLTGKAADISTSHNPTELGRLAAEFGWFNGIKVYAWGIHVDIRTGPRYWIGVPK
ncbi:MAG TPA: D-Ala-D-Ala carboxypeptidase family metallohydrolase [bacterium]|mgnify:FL=1|nr:D-Ala-D-Ala carboxypeptidase family metallohydrolase [bacterium]